MTTELRKAAERLFECPNWRNRVGPWKDILEAIDGLHQAYLAELPADDDEPVAVEKELRRAGFEIHPGGFGCCYVNFNAPNARGQMQVTLSLTKGQLRSLLKSLGIEVKP